MKKCNVTIITICLLVFLGGCGSRKVKEHVGGITCNDGEISLHTTSYRNKEDNKLYIHIDLVYKGKIVSEDIGRKGFPVVGDRSVKFLKVNHKSESGLNIYVDPKKLNKEEFNNLVRCIQLNEHDLVSIINEIPNQHISEQELRERQSVNALVYGNYEEMGKKFYAGADTESQLHVYVAIDGTCQLRNDKEWRTLGRVFEGYLDISEVHYNRIKNYRSKNGMRFINYLRMRNIRVVYEDE